MVGELLRSSNTKRKLCHNPFNKHQRRFLLSKQNAVARALRDFFHNVNIPSFKGNYNCQSRSFHQIFHSEIKWTSSALVSYFFQHAASTRQVLYLYPYKKDHRLADIYRQFWIRDTGQEHILIKSLYWPT